MSVVLVTGASGFVGRNCLPILVKKGYGVHALSRQRPLISIPGVTWHEMDLLRPGVPSECVERVRPNVVLHLAWYAVSGKFWTAPENVEWVRASLELVEAFVAHGGRRLVSAGSCAEYELNPGECFESKTRLHPVSLYGTCKHAFGSIADSFSRQCGISSAWGRIFFLYGPHEQPSRLLAYVVRSLLNGESALCSGGEQILDFLHVEDAASAFVALLESPVEGPVNVASGNPVVVRELLQEIGRQFGTPELIRLGTRESSSDFSKIWANTARLTKEVGWKPHYDLTSGIRNTIEWWRNSSVHRPYDPQPVLKSSS